MVSDEVTGNPINNIQVTVNCWVYDTDIWESREIEKSTVTDSIGKFSVNFAKGEALDITVKSENYNEYQESITLKKSTNYFDIKLKKKRISPLNS